MHGTPAALYQTAIRTRECYCASTYVYDYLSSCALCIRAHMFIHIHTRASQDIHLHIIYICMAYFNCSLYRCMPRCLAHILGFACFHFHTSPCTLQGLQRNLALGTRRAGFAPAAPSQGAAEGHCRDHCTDDTGCRFWVQAEWMFRM